MLSLIAYNILLLISLIIIIGEFYSLFDRTAWWCKTLPVRGWPGFEGVIDAAALAAAADAEKCADVFASLSRTPAAGELIDEAPPVAE